MPTILLIRHANNDYVKKGRLAGRLPGVHLSENGQKQAAEVAEKLAEIPIKAIYSSPLDRAMETAAPIADKHSLKIRARPGLTEVDIGDWQGKKIKGLSRLKIWKVVQGAPARMRFPGGETFFEAQYRICQELEALAVLHQPEDIIICVSHADPIKLAVAFYLGLPLDLFQRVIISPASISVLRLGENGNSLLTLNHEFSFSLPTS
jgi:probable phosphomutase (TIGR03848 family)